MADLTSFVDSCLDNLGLGNTSAEPGGRLDLLGLGERGRIDAFRQGGGLPQQFPVSLSDGRIRATAEVVAARLRRVMSVHGFQFKSAKGANPVKTQLSLSEMIGSSMGLFCGVNAHVGCLSVLDPQRSWRQRREEMMGKKGLREQLIGAWRLVSYIESPVDGSPKRFPMGEKAQGIIMYTPDGYMSAQLMTPGRRNFASGDWFKGTPEETAEEASGYIAYSGPFHVDEDHQSLTHSMNVSLFPGWIGQTQPRVVKIDGNRLHLGTASPIKSGGTDVMADLIWVRAEANN